MITTQEEADEKTKQPSTPSFDGRKRTVISSDQSTEPGLAEQIARLLDLKEDEKRFLITYENNYGRSSLRELLKDSMAWSKMKPYPDRRTNPDPT